MSAQATPRREGMDECIRNCTECHRVCLETVDHCLKLGGDHAGVDHIGLLLDCAELCQTSANFMIRDSVMHRRVCGVCADLCDRCAADCERMGADDAQLKASAEVCRRCAESCRQMAKATAAD
jgi:hypothetical protein